MITRYDPKTLKKLWGGSEARASIDGPRMAEKGDRRFMDKEVQSGPTRVEFKGQYESIGMENQPKGSSQEISEKDKRERNDAIDAHRKGGSKGPTPSFKAVPSDADRKKYGEEYEHWRLINKVFVGS
jgi:hypothetical protein